MRQYAKVVSAGGEEILGDILRELGYNPVHKYKYRIADPDSPQDWEADHAVLKYGIFYEYEGLPGEVQTKWGRYEKKSRHTTRSGYAGDCNKYNHAAVMGFALLRYNDISLNKEQVRLDTERVIEHRREAYGLRNLDRCALCFSEIYVPQSMLVEINKHFPSHSCLECQYKIKVAVKRREENGLLYANAGKRRAEMEIPSRRIGRAILDEIYLVKGQWMEEKEVLYNRWSDEMEKEYGTNTVALYGDPRWMEALDAFKMLNDASTDRLFSMYPRILGQNMSIQEVKEYAKDKYAKQ